MRASLIGFMLLASPALAADTVVVCPDGFRAALRPWLEHRTKQGHSLLVISATGSAEQIQTDIRRLAQRHALRFVVLVGDAEPTQGRRDRENKPLSVPTIKCKARVICKLGRDIDIATDNPYGDLNADGVPELAVGRLSVDTPGQLRTIVRKILDYERPEQSGRWQRRVNFVAGVGGFSALADIVLENCAKQFITRGVPAAYHTTMTRASWRSPYCPDPLRFRETTIGRLNEGCLFWVYIGHGQSRALDHLQTPGDRFFPIFGCRDVKKLNCSRGAPIALFLACYTAAFDQPQECLAEELLRHDGGPVAVIGGSRVTMPYGMGVMAMEMMRECFIHRRKTIGEIVLRAKRSLVLRSRDDLESKTLDWLARTLSVNSDLAAERAEHVLLFNLLGDPLLRIPHPAKIQLTAAPTVQAGDELSITGVSEIDGVATVELVVRRDRLTFSPPARAKFRLDDVATRKTFQATYRKANDPRLAETTVLIRDGKFSLKLRIPLTAEGACHVRVFVQSKRDFAAGALDVEVRPVHCDHASDR